MFKVKERTLVFLFLLISVVSFFSFGFYHLAKFETTDEHLWKYDRIPQYWNSLKAGDLEKTYINDKPGITVALISGIGLLSEPNPKADATLPSGNALLEKYDYQQSEKTNFYFRFPILIFASLSLLAFFYLSLKAFGSRKIAVAITALISANTILIGMSQIINPDSFFWIFGGLSILSYLAFLNNRERKFLIACGILTGFALLSKYTAFILFLFFILASLAKIIFQKPADAAKSDWKFILKEISNIVIIFVISNLIFAIFLPAVFIHPEYLFKGISQFLNLKMILAAAVLVAALSALIYFQRNIIGKISQYCSQKQKLFTAIPLLLLSFILFISIINVWTGQNLAPVSDLKDQAYANEPKDFSFKPIMNNKDRTFFNNFQLYLMESYPFIFSISPLFILLIFFAVFLSFKKKISSQSAVVIFSSSIFILLYVYSTLMAKIITNARYSIILYPVVSILAVFILKEIFAYFKINDFKKWYWTIFAFLIFSWTILFSIKPFYFCYSSKLLPNQYTVHDSWGHGAYEAAQYLNSLPDAESLIIYSNSETVCRFFKGSCLKSRKIDLAKIQPDYFVFTKRGIIKEKNHFILSNNPDKNKDFNYYLKKMENNYTWQLSIDNRPDNFIKIVEFEK